MGEIAKDQSFPRDPDRTDVGVIGGTWRNTVTGVIWDYIGQYNIEADKLMSNGHVWKRRVSSVSEQVQTDYTQNDSTAKDYIKNRPGGYEEGFEITWDGDTTGRVSFSFTKGEITYYVCKVSDMILTADMVKGGNVSMYYGGKMEGLLITDGDIMEMDIGIELYNAIFSIRTAGTDSLTGLTFPEPGTYFSKGVYNGTESMRIISMSNISVYPFPDKYIPDTIARKAELDSRITEKEVILTSSTTDSTKKFKITVNDSGTLTATEITE